MSIGCSPKLSRYNIGLKELQAFLGLSEVNRIMKLSLVLIILLIASIPIVLKVSSQESSENLLDNATLNLAPFDYFYVSREKTTGNWGYKIGSFKQGKTNIYYYPSYDSRSWKRVEVPFLYKAMLSNFSIWVFLGEHHGYFSQFFFDIDEAANRNGVNVLILHLETPILQYPYDSRVFPIGPYSFSEVSLMRIIEIFFLGFVQGVTEWFPISSSGHLVVFQELLGINVSVAFDVMLHLGTLIGVIWFLRRDLLTILKAVLKLDFSSKEGRVFIYVVIGIIPTALIGFLLKDFFEAMFSNLFSTGIAMLVNGVLLYSTKYSKPKKDLDAFDSLLIGFAQAAAITPGISRMGITVSTALLRGVEGGEAYRFSLLLSILSIIGGSIVKLGDVNFEQESFPIILGIIVTAIVGYLALRVVRKYVVKQNFHRFAYYCLLVGAFILFLSIAKNPNI